MIAGKGFCLKSLAQKYFCGNRCGKGEITGEQAIEKLHENSLSTIAGIVFATAGEGSAVGQKIAEASKSIVSSVVSGIKSAISAVGNAVKSVASGIKSAFSAVVGAFS
ncbi:hypothetical protein [Helicobacter felis]|uniref:hypothetical protein n=1 Tax=Helicobacter felis TaxID=214 RepID=UPI0018F83A71|nr:hypothetical protein [Helicobacter felis]